MIGISEKRPSNNYEVKILDSESEYKLVNISLYEEVKELVPNEKYQVEWYNLQTVSNKTQSEIMEEVEADWDNYLSLAKEQMNKEAVENSTQIDQTALALTEVYEMLLG